MTVADVALIADLEESTVLDWTRRGAVTAQADGSYAVIDALRLAAVGSLVKSGVPVYRAAEAIATAEGNPDFWLDASTPQENLWIYTVAFGSQVFRALHYAGDSVAADLWIGEQFSDSQDTAAVADNGSHVLEYPESAGAPRFRIVRYDIGADLRMALREIAK